MTTLTEIHMQPLPFRPLVHFPARLLGCPSEGSKPDHLATDCAPQSCVDVRPLSGDTMHKLHYTSFCLLP